jgi:hypothetical protein
MKMSYSPEDMLTPNDRLTKALLAGGVVLGLMLVLLLSPETIPGSRCSFRELTGHSCFTCGFTRSLSAMSHGNLQASLQYHLMGPIVFGGMILASILWFAEASMGRRIIAKANGTIRKNASLGLALLWIIFGSVRFLTELI